VTFWPLFIRLLPHRPGQALAALYWHVTRRRVRARNRLRLASADLPFVYPLWIAKSERIPQQIEQFRKTIDAWSWRPRFAILIHAHAEVRREQVERSIESIQAQVYPDWTIVDATTASVADAIASCDAEYIVPVRAGDLLSEAALFRFAEALQSNPGAAVCYGDEDVLDERGRRSDPWFKPRWNTEMFLAQDYLSRATAIATPVALCAAKRSGPDMDAVILNAVLASRDDAIAHVPNVISHVDRRFPDTPLAKRLEIISQQIGSNGASCRAGPFGTVKVDWPLPDCRPLVSIIVPTKDKVELLRPCIESLLRLTDYPRFEILVLDNASTKKATANYFREIETDPRVRVVPYPGPYNFSAINNYAARKALGSFLCLLNNDTEVVAPAWLTEMMRYAVRSEVGAVGAKLLYEDGTIQHAGVVIGIGGAAGHAHRFLPSDQPGYFRQAHISQYVSAVTAACLLIDKKKYMAVGGLDEECLAVAFNDVDFCLKLQCAGFRNVYVPHAVLLHHESKSRGKDSSPENVQRYRRELAVLQNRWGTDSYDDPLHNPNLERSVESFVIRL